MSIVSELGGIPGKQTISELVAGFGKQKKYILGPGPVDGEEETIDGTEVYCEPLYFVFNKDSDYISNFFDELFQNFEPFSFEFDGKAFEVNSQTELKPFIIKSNKVSGHDFSTYPFGLCTKRREGSDVETDIWIVVADNNPHTFGLYRMESGSESKEDVVIVEVGVEYGENPTASLMNYSFMEVYSMLMAKDGPIVAFRKLYANGGSAGVTTLIAEASATTARQYIYIEFFEPRHYDNLGVEKITFSSDRKDDNVESFAIAYVDEQVETGAG
jgi:hypothetical protein